jgi:hypothetical protein
VLAAVLIAESMFGALRVAELVPRLPGYDAVAVALIVARGLLGPLQFVSGWLLATRKPQGLALAPWAFLTSAALTPFDVGLGLAPTGIYAWLRWQVTLAYVACALAAAEYLRRRTRTGED